LKFPAISVLLAAFWRPFALQFQCAGDNSLFCTEQAIVSLEQGNHFLEQGIHPRRARARRFTRAAQACLHGHPRLPCGGIRKAWVAGTGAAMAAPE
jgi:hypothetical protein